MKIISESCRRIEIADTNGDMVAAVEKIRVIEYETFDEERNLPYVDILEQQMIINLDRHNSTCSCGVAL